MLAGVSVILLRIHTIHSGAGIALLEVSALWYLEFGVQYIIRCGTPMLLKTVELDLYISRI